MGNCPSCKAEMKFVSTELPLKKPEINPSTNIKCQSCEKILKVPARLIGKMGNCPSCKAEMKFVSTELSSLKAKPSFSANQNVHSRSSTEPQWTTAPTTQPVFQMTSAPQRSTSDDMRALIHYQANAKSAGLAFVFWWFFGMFGAHRFYCGKNNSAVAQLLITIISIPLCLLLIGFISLFANAIWVLIDVFLISGWIRESNQRLAHFVAP